MFHLICSCEYHDTSQKKRNQDSITLHSFSPNHIPKQIKSYNCSCVNIRRQKFWMHVPLTLQYESSSPPQRSSDLGRKTQPVEKFKEMEIRRPVEEGDYRALFDELQNSMRHYMKLCLIRRQTNR